MKSLFKVLSAAIITALLTPTGFAQPSSDQYAATHIAEKGGKVSFPGAAYGTVSRYGDASGRTVFAKAKTYESKVYALLMLNEGGLYSEYKDSRSKLNSNVQINVQSGDKIVKMKISDFLKLYEKNPRNYISAAPKTPTQREQPSDYTDDSCRCSDSYCTDCSNCRCNYCNCNRCSDYWPQQNQGENQARQARQAGVAAPVTPQKSGGHTTPGPSHAAPSGGHTLPGRK